MALKDVHEAVLHGKEMVTDYYDLVSKHETSTRYAIIDPILRALGWKIWDPNECEVEYQLKNGRVDYALFDRVPEVVMLVEAKRLDKDSSAFERQLSKYSRGMGDGMCVLTDGKRWHLYVMGEKGRFKDKHIESVDIVDQSVRQAAQKLNSYIRRSLWW